MVLEGMAQVVALSTWALSNGTIELFFRTKKNADLFALTQNKNILCSTYNVEN